MCVCVFSFLPRVFNRDGFCTSPSESPAAAPEDKDAANIKLDHHSPSPAIPPSRVIFVRPAAAENTWDNVETGTDG